MFHQHSRGDLIGVGPMSLNRLAFEAIERTIHTGRLLPLHTEYRAQVILAVSASPSPLDQRIERQPSQGIILLTARDPQSLLAAETKRHACGERIFAARDAIRLKRVVADCVTDCFRYVPTKPFFDDPRFELQGTAVDAAVLWDRAVQFELVRKLEITIQKDALRHPGVVEDGNPFGFEMAVPSYLNVADLMLSEQRQYMEFYIAARVCVLIADLGRDDDQLIERSGACLGFNDPAHQNAGRLHTHSV